jgi:hypothetical protein
MSESLPQSSPPAAEVSPAQLVRATVCTLCWALPGQPCQDLPDRADHLRRWLDTYTTGLIGNEEMTEVFRQVIVITKWQLVPERAA